MALDKLVDSTQLDNNLTSVANAIRAKSGGTGQLAFPAGFVSEIGNISGGGGVTPTGTKEITITENGTVTEDVINYASVQITANVSGGSVGISLEDVLNRSVTGDVEVTVTNLLPLNKNIVPLYNGLFYGAKISSLTMNGIQKVPDNVANQNAVGTNGNQSVLLSVSFPDALICGTYSFQDARRLVSASLPSLQYGYYNYVKLSTGAFSGCTSLTNVDIGSIDRICSNMFQNCSSLAFLELKAVKNIEANAFSGASSLATLVIRSSTVPTLDNINAFANTPFASGKAGGTLYVPQSLISSYQSATNWSTILGYSTNQILPIEGSEYEV